VNGERRVRPTSPIKSCSTPTHIRFPTSCVSTHPRFEGSQDFSKDRYTTREYHEAEKRDLWSKVWQYACREDEILEPGGNVLANHRLSESERQP